MSNIETPRFIGKNASANYLSYLASDAQFRLRQAEAEGAALRGDFGPECQLTALSERYKQLRAAGQFEQAAAVKAQGVALYNSLYKK